MAAQIGTRKLTLMVDGDEVAPEVSSATVVAGESDSDFVSFYAASQGGGREYKLKLVMVQDATVGSLWDRVWSQAGEEIAVVVRPYGNAVATAAQPHFSGDCVISEPDGELLGGEADASTSARFVTEVEWTFTEKPTRIVA